MLSKLLKYEIKATARIFLPLVAVLLIFAGINRTVSELSGNTMRAPKIISMMLYISILIGVFVVTLVVMIQRFYKNLLTDEGYLMFTLPVKAWQHIVSKLAVSLMWTAVCSIASIISVVIIAADDVLTPQVIRAFVNGLKEFYNYLGTTAVLLTVEIILAAIASILSNMLLIYASIAMGHLANRYKILAGIGAFIALNTVPQIVLSIIGTVAAGFGFSYNFNISSISEFSAVINFMHGVMWFSIVFNAVFAAGYFLLTNLILTKRLNLE